MRRLLPLLLIASGAVAADAKPPTPPDDAPTVDDATAKRAQAAIDGYDHPADAPVADPDATREIAEIETLIGEAEQDIAAHRVDQATPSFLAASDRLRAMPGPQIAALGKRARAANDRLAKLAQAVLAEPGLLPNEEPRGDEVTPQERERADAPAQADATPPAEAPAR